MAIVGKNTKVYASINGADFFEITGINSYSCEFNFDMLDTTSFMSASTAGDYLGAKTRIAGLADYPVSISGDFSEETTGQGTLRTCKRTSVPAYIKILPNGTTGYTFTGYISKIGYKSQTKDKVTVSFDLVTSAAVAAI